MKKLDFILQTLLITLSLLGLALLFWGGIYLLFWAGLSLMVAQLVSALIYLAQLNELTKEVRKGVLSYLYAVAIYLAVLAVGCVVVPQTTFIIFWVVLVPWPIAAHYYALAIRQAFRRRSKPGKFLPNVSF